MTEEERLKEFFEFNSSWITKNEALMKLADLNAKQSDYFPDEATDEIHKILKLYDHRARNSAWDVFSDYFILTSDEEARSAVKKASQEELGIEKIAYYLYGVNQSALWYQSEHYGALENITRKDIPLFIKKAVEIVAEN